MSRISMNEMPRIEAFLNSTLDMKGQVCVVDKIDGTPHYIDPYSGRNYTKDYRVRFTDKYKCPLSTCTHDIEIVHMEKGRDYFRHKRDHSGIEIAHSSSEYPESMEHHLGKMMLLGMIRSKDSLCDDEIGFDKDEYYLRDIHRIPDVFTYREFGKERSSLAMEMEYKESETVDFNTKQECYYQAGVNSQWILGVSRNHIAPADRGSSDVQVSNIARSISKHQHGVIFLNPITGEVGTLVSRNHMDGSDKIWNNHDNNMSLIDRWSYANISLSRWEECEYSRYIGVVTPEMSKEWGLYGNIHEMDDKFMNSRCSKFYSDHFNRKLCRPTNGVVHIEALHIHWQYAIYMNLIHDCEGEPFRVGDIYDVLEDEGINFDKKRIMETLRPFLYMLKGRDPGCLRSEEKNGQIHKNSVLVPTKNVDLVLTWRLSS